MTTDNDFPLSGMTCCPVLRFSYAKVLFQYLHEVE